jgi:predicted dehydrogenase
VTDPGTEPLRVGIIGCGLIGDKRAAALGSDVVVGAFDVDPARSEGLCRTYGGVACGSTEELFALCPDVVVVATIHSALAEHAVAAIESGAHVLVEKPGGIGVREIDSIRTAARAHGRLVKVGFNHRFHPGIARAVTEARSGAYGPVLSVRGRYGHGGRPGYDKEWRAQPELSGGGEVVDQGMHLLDLAHWTAGPLPLHSAMLRTQFWAMPVDDNAVLLLGTNDGPRDTSPFALIHVSWTEWKNTFSLEIACRTAKITVDGLGRSYGAETLRIYRMRPELGPPDLEEIVYPDEDTSWVAEWRHFTDAIAAGSGEGLLGDLDDARYCWGVIEAAQAS